MEQEEGGGGVTDARYDIEACIFCPFFFLLLNDGGLLNVNSLGIYHFLFCNGSCCVLFTVGHGIFHPVATFFFFFSKIRF